VSSRNTSAKTVTPTGVFPRELRGIQVDEIHGALQAEYSLRGCGALQGLVIFVIRLRFGSAIKQFTSSEAILFCSARYVIDPNLRCCATQARAVPNSPMVSNR
jgi:hypothetical protein